MPLQTIQGVGGSFTTISGFNAKFNAWTANITNETVETTGFSDAGNSTNESGGPVKLEGTAVGVAQFDAATTALIPSAALGATPTFSSWKGTVTLTAATGCTYGFTAVVSGVSTGRQYNGRMEVTISFVSSGAITQTWDESA